MTSSLSVGLSVSHVDLLGVLQYGLGSCYEAKGRGVFLPQTVLSPNASPSAVELTPDLVRPEIVNQLNGLAAAHHDADLSLSALKFDHFFYRNGTHVVSHVVFEDTTPAAAPASEQRIDSSKCIQTGSHPPLAGVGLRGGDDEASGIIRIARFGTTWAQSPPAEAYIIFGPLSLSSTKSGKSTPHSHLRSSAFFICGNISPH